MAAPTFSDLAIAFRAASPRYPYGPLFQVYGLTHRQCGIPKSCDVLGYVQLGDWRDGDPSQTLVMFTQVEGSFRREFDAFRDLSHAAGCMLPRAMRDRVAFPPINAGDAVGWWLSFMWLTKNVPISKPPRKLIGISIWENGFWAAADVIEHWALDMDGCIPPTLAVDSISPPDRADRPDTQKKFGVGQVKPVPENPDVRDLCLLLAGGIPEGKSPIHVAREFVGEDEKKAQSLMRQARRFRHLWDRNDQPDT